MEAPTLDLIDRKNSFLDRVLRHHREDLNFLDVLHDLLALYPALAYINLILVLIFYGLTTVYLFNKLQFKKIKQAETNSFCNNVVKLALVSLTIACGWRFMPPEFINSTPIRVLMHPRYLATFIYDTIIFLTIFMLLLQIPRIGRYFVCIAVFFIFTYSLMAFITFFHIKRLPTAKEFKLGGQILLVSPISYFMLALKVKPIQFIVGYAIPLFITVLGINKIELRSLIIKPFFSFRMSLLLSMIPLITLGLWVLEIPIKNKAESLITHNALNQNINRLGIFKYQLFLFDRDIIHKNNYNPEEIKNQTEELLKKYPADKLNSNSSMPQIILGWASESFKFPESIDTTLTNQDKINPNFKKLLQQNVANSISSSFPLIGGGTVLGEATLLASMQLDLPKQGHPSLVSYYKSLGYTTAYIHVVADTFYSYQERSRFYGFDEIYLGSYFKSSWGNDKALFDKVKKRIEKAIYNNEKLFIAFIDISKHGPYEFYGDKKKELVPQLIKTYNTNDESMLNYIYKNNIADEYLGDLISFINKQKVPIALMLNADHVPSGFKKNYEVEGDEAKYMSNFLFYHNQRRLILPAGYNYIHQSLVPSLFLQSLGMPLRPFDKYILAQPKTQKTYKLPIMEQLPYDLALGQQISKPLFELQKQKTN